MSKGKHRVTTSKHRASTSFWRRRVGSVSILAVLIIGGATIALASHTKDFINLVDAEALIVHDGAVFKQGPLAAGTGQFNPFLTLNSSGNADTEQGHNTNAKGTGNLTTYDAFFGGGGGDGRTIALQVAAIPETTFDGNLYREFVLDANDSGNDKCMSIDDIRIFIDTQNDLKGFNPILGTFFNDSGPAAGPPIYDLDVPILMSSQRTGAPSCGGTGTGLPGSGIADITVLIPNSLFPENCNYGNESCGKWLYFWTQKGGFDPSTLSSAADRTKFGPFDWNVSAGFEEWNTRLRPVVSVTKTAVPSYTQSHVWTIEKLVAEGAGVTDDTAFDDAQTLDMFTGDSEDVTWKVTVTKGAAQTSNVKVAGIVTVKNPTGPGQLIPSPIPATINSVTDVLTLGGVVTNVPLSCPVTFPYTLAAGATLTCTYDQAVASATDGVNTATANINFAGATKDYSGSKDVLFSTTDPTVVDGSVTVTDTNGSAWSTTGTTSWTYDEPFACDDDEGQNNNEASFVTSTTATSGSDDADVFVNCYRPLVSKTVSGTYDIGNTWEIDKGDDGNYHLFAGDSVEHDYDIDVTLSQTDGPGKVSGTVTVVNPNPEDDLVVPVVDTLSDGTDVTLSCNIVPVLDLYTIPAGDELNCTYTDVADPDRNATSNTVTVTLNGIEYEATEDFTYSTTDTGVQGVGVIDENEQDGTTTYGPFTGDDTIETSSEYECSTDVTDYEVDGTYMYSVDNTATLTDELDVKFGTPATATVKVTCYIPVVSKTADGSSDERHEWEIVKDFDETYDLFAGQSVTHDYEIGLTEIVTYENFEVTGKIDITNPHPTEPMTVTVADQLDDLTDATIDSCTGGTLTGDSLEIPANTTATCDYTASPADDEAEENTATVTTENDVDVSASADISWSSSVVGYDAVNVTDDYATVDPADDEKWGPVATSDTFEYSRVFTCPTDLTMYPNGVYTKDIVNTATINETGADDDATVTLNCYALGVSKTADTTYTRTYDWKIVKDAVDADGVSIGPDGLMLAFGQSYLLDWKVTVSLADTPYVDSDHRVDGVITITNPSPAIAMVNVADGFTPTGGLPIALSVDCDPVLDGPQSTGVQVPAEGSLECTYGYATADDGVNTATATLVQAPMTVFTGTEDVVFGAPTTLVNDSVIVTDAFNGGPEDQLGTATVGESPKMFTVSTLLSSDPGHSPAALLECGENLIVNDATVYVNDDSSLGAQLGTASREVPVLVACDFGCTLTQGYWKTHNTLFWGGAPADDTWFLIGDADGDGFFEGAEEEFFNSGQTWFDVMWTAPKGGNAYYQLAHQWIAATLNVLNGAGTTPAVDAALAYGEDFFTNNLPDGNFKGKAGKDIRAYASTLGAYNEGDIGPGHCDEDGLSVAIAPLLIGAYFWQRRRGRHRATR